MKKSICFSLRALGCALVLTLSAALPLAGCNAAPAGYTFAQEPANSRQILPVEYSTPKQPNDIEARSEFMEPILSGKFLGNTDFILRGEKVYATGLFEVETVYKGSYEEKYIEVAYVGGYIPLDVYMVQQVQRRADLSAYERIPAEERAGWYIEQRVQGPVSKPEPGKSYLLLLSLTSSQEYTVRDDNYDMMPMQNGKAYDYGTGAYTAFSFMQPPE